MKLGVVVPCFQHDRWLDRTLPAIERALDGRDWRGALVVHGSGTMPPAGDRWRVLSPRPFPPLTPGGARMLGLAAVDGDWVLFVDADTEIDSDWTRRALDEVERDPDVAGFGGRIEEWVVDGARERPGSPDLNRVGDDERQVELLTTPALYRRASLLAVGGYDARLNAEEDFELGLRLAHSGHWLRLLRGPAGRHWNEPRPSIAELERRWSTGLAFGPGQALRLYLGRPGFTRLLDRQRLPLSALALWLFGVFALVQAASGDDTPLLLWLTGLIAVIALMVVRKRSVRLALLSLLAWTVNGAGLVVGFFNVPGGPRARPA
jgi:hypothetical protein